MEDAEVISIYSGIAEEWHSFKPPARPSKKDLEFYEKSIESIKKKV